MNVQRSALAAVNDSPPDVPRKEPEPDIHTSDEVLGKQTSGVQGCIEIHRLRLTLEQQTRRQKIVTVKDDCG